VVTVVSHNNLKLQINLGELRLSFFYSIYNYMTETIKDIIAHLGIEKKKQFIPLEELKNECASREIKTAQAYYSRYREIPGGPSNPDKAYKDWVSWKDLLGK
jgi:hypothetical protein